MSPPLLDPSRWRCRGPPHPEGGVRLRSLAGEAERGIKLVPLYLHIFIARRRIYFSWEDGVRLPGEHPRSHIDRGPVFAS